MRSVKDMTEEELSRVLTYAGFVLVAFELVKSLIVKPIKFFYLNTTFGESMPFNSYKEDVMSRHRNEFEACLLYLRDFMKALNSEDLLAIQALRKHRNTLAHDLANNLHSLNIESYVPLLEKANKALFKLSNYHTYIEIGADPKFKNKGINWDTVKGHEYMLFEDILNKIKILHAEGNNA